MRSHVVEMIKMILMGIAVVVDAPGMAIVAPRRRTVLTIASGRASISVTMDRGTTWWVVRVPIPEGGIIALVKAAVAWIKLIAVGGPAAAVKDIATQPAARIPHRS